jgi:SOS response regulatory protein OraA/RecX
MFTPSPSQQAALARMAAMAGLRESPPPFVDAAAFQAYWELVARRADRERRLTPAERIARQQRKSQRIKTYYQHVDHLVAYGRAYAVRFQPSLEKLRQQLAKKCADVALVEQAMVVLADSLNDRRRAQELAEMMQAQGRTAQAIRAKLRLRKFSQEVITECLAALAEATGSVLQNDAVVRQVQRFQRKGLSQRAMRQRFGGQSADAPVVAAAMEQALGSQGDDQALRIAIARASRKSLDRRALIQRLSGKGFRYGDIIRVLSDPPQPAG